MKPYLKKSTYFFAIFFISLLILLCCHLLFGENTSSTPDHATLTLTPFTAREQKALIAKQEQAAQLDINTPLVAQMSASDAEARVLNVTHSPKPSA